MYYGYVYQYSYYDYYVYATMLIAILTMTAIINIIIIMIIVSIMVTMQHLSVHRCWASFHQSLQQVVVLCQPSVVQALLEVHGRVADVEPIPSLLQQSSI